MSTYNIDFSEPLRAGFVIEAGALDGPGGSTTNSPLRLYGRGALEWGEAVDEDLLRLSENFCSASPPLNPIAGQTWAALYTYYHNSSLSSTQGWYRYNLSTRVWELINGTGVIASAPTAGQTYYYDATSKKLYGYYSLVQPVAATYVERMFMTQAGAPSASLVPRMEIFVYAQDSNTGTSNWKIPCVAHITDDTSIPTTSANTGCMWFDRSTGILKFFNGTTWTEIVGPSNSASTLTHALSVSNNRITDVGTPTATNDAVNKGYVDGLVAGTGYLPLAGGTLTVANTPGLTVYRNTSSANSLIRFQTNNNNVYVGQGTSGQFNVGSSADLSSGSWLSLSLTQASFSGNVGVSLGLSVSGAATFYNTVTVGGDINLTTHKLLNVATGTASTDGVNKGQMDSAISSGAASAVSAHVAAADPHTQYLMASDITDQTYAGSNVKSLVQYAGLTVNTGDATQLRVAIGLIMYPVGSVMIRHDATNPGTLFGGVWTQFAQGRTLVGLNSADASFNAISAIGGEKAHALTASEIPPLPYRDRYYVDKDSFTSSPYKEDMPTNYNNKAGSGDTDYDNLRWLYYDTYTSNSPFGVTAHNNMPPFYVVNFWRRTA